MELNSVYKDFQINKVGKEGIAIDILPRIGNNGDWKEVTGKDAIILSIRNLLMTPLGQYPFDPTYGSLLHKQLFELATEPTFENIKYEVKTRIEQFEPRVQVLDVQITWSKTKKYAKVDVTLKIRNEVNKTKLSLEMQNYAQEMFTSLSSSNSKITY